MRRTNDQRRILRGMSIHMINVFGMIASEQSPIRPDLSPIWWDESWDFRPY